MALMPIVYTKLNSTISNVSAGKGGVGGMGWGHSEAIQGVRLSNRQTDTYQQTYRPKIRRLELLRTAKIKCHVTCDM